MIPVIDSQALLTQSARPPSTPQYCIMRHPPDTVSALWLGIARSRSVAWYAAWCDVHSKKTLERWTIPLAGLAQHPSGRLVNQIVRVFHEHCSDPEGRVQLSESDPVQRCDNRDAPLPQIG